MDLATTMLLVANILTLIGLIYVILGSWSKFRDRFILIEERQTNLYKDYLELKAQYIALESSLRLKVSKVDYQRDLQELKLTLKEIHQYLIQKK